MVLAENGGEIIERRNGGHLDLIVDGEAAVRLTPMDFRRVEEAQRRFEAPSLNPQVPHANRAKQVGR